MHRLKTLFLIHLYKFIFYFSTYVSMQTYLKLNRAAKDRHQGIRMIRMPHYHPEADVLEDDPQKPCGQLMSVKEMLWEVKAAGVILTIRLFQY